MTPMAIAINVMGVPDSGCSSPVSLAGARLTTRRYRRLGRGGRRGGVRDLRLRDQFGLAARVELHVDDRESPSQLQHARSCHEIGELRLAQEIDVQAGRDGEYD